LHVEVPSRRVVGIKPTADPYRVLVVDDQPENRKVMSRMLEAVGYRIREANDGAEAVASFAEWEPHAILMDMLMPKMGGAEAIRQIRATPAGQTPFILAVSASAFDENRQQALAAGADGFLSKALPRSRPAGAAARASGGRVHLGRPAGAGSGPTVRPQRRPQRIPPWRGFLPLCARKSTPLLCTPTMIGSWVWPISWQRWTPTGRAFCARPSSDSTTRSLSTMCKGGQGHV